jgi:hypothetical protein
MIINFSYSNLVSDDSTDESVEEHGIVVAGRVNGLGRLKLVVDTQGQVRGVDGDVNLLPLRVVQVLADQDSFVLRDQVGVEIESAVSQLEAEVSVALADGHEPVADRRAELHVKLVALSPTKKIYVKCLIRKKL